MTAGKQLKQASEYLLKYRKALENEKIIRKRIEYLEEKKRQQREKYLGSNFPMGIKTNSAVKKDLSDIVEKIVDIYDREIICMIRELEENSRIARNIYTVVSISNLEDTEKEYILLRFFEGKPNADIKKAIGYSERSIYNIRKKALSKVGEKIGEIRALS